MALEGETIHLGAPAICPECKTILKEEVLLSRAGYYIGTRCKCGPYSRESHYYETMTEATLAMLEKNVKYRDGDYHG